MQFHYNPLDAGSTKKTRSQLGELELAQPVSRNPDKSIPPQHIIHSVCLQRAAEVRIKAQREMSVDRQVSLPITASEGKCWAWVPPCASSLFHIYVLPSGCVFMICVCLLSQQQRSTQIIIITPLLIDFTSHVFVH